MQLSTEVVGDVGVIRVRGDWIRSRLRNSTTPLWTCSGDGARSLVIDCRDIAFIDSAGLQVMVRAHQEAHAHGGTVTVRRPSAFTLRLLQTVGLDTVLIIDGLPENRTAPRSTEPRASTALVFWNCG